MYAVSVPSSEHWIDAGDSVQSEPRWEVMYKRKVYAFHPFNIPSSRK